MKKKLNRKQRAERRAMYANTFQEGFRLGWELALRTYNIQVEDNYESEEIVSITSKVRRNDRIQ